MLQGRWAFTSSLGRAVLAHAVAVAIVLAGLLSAAPAWHEYLHHDALPTHLCAVTFFASGHCVAGTDVPPAVLPDRPFLLETLVPFRAPALSRAHFFARLEHAPPTFA